MNISIAMTTFNGEKYLKQQLDSLLNQTTKADEIIICDDNSSDDSYSMLVAYATENPEIKLYRNNINLGYVKNFEKVLSLCSGDYIALCDQDDVWFPEKLTILRSQIGNKLLIHSDAVLIDSNENLIHKSFTKLIHKKPIPDFYDLFLSNSVTGCTMLVSHKLIQKALPFPTNLPHDWWLALVAANEDSIVYYPQPLVSYRQHSTNAIGSASLKKTSFINHLREIKYLIKRRNRSLEGAKNICDDLILNGLPIQDPDFSKFRDTIDLLNSLIEKKTISLKGVSAYLLNSKFFRKTGEEKEYIFWFQLILSWYWL